MGVALVGIGPRHRLSHHIRRHSRKRKSSPSLVKQWLQLMIPSVWRESGQYSLGSMITQYLALFYRFHGPQKSHRHIVI
jgi:hypothetical protein